MTYHALPSPKLTTDPIVASAIAGAYERFAQAHSLTLSVLTGKAWLLAKSPTVSMSVGLTLRSAQPALLVSFPLPFSFFCR